MENIIYETLYPLSFTLYLATIVIHIIGIGILLRKKGKLKNHHLILVNISLISISFCIIQMPRSVYTYTLSTTMQKEVDQKLSIHYNRSNTAVAWVQLEYVLTIFIQTADKFLAIIKPLHYRNLCTKKRCKITLSISWCISTALFVVALFTYQENTPKIVGLIIMIVLVVTYMLTVLAYSRIFYRIHHRKMSSTAHVNSNKMLLITFMICIIFSIFYVIPSIIFTVIVNRLRAYTFNGAFVPVYTIGIFLDGLIYIILKKKDRTQNSIKLATAKYSSRNSKNSETIFTITEINTQEASITTSE